MNKAERCREFARVMRWLVTHPEDKYKLIDYDEPYKATDYLEIIRQLEEDSLEYLIPLILVVIPFNVEFGHALGRLTAEALIEQWERMGPEGFLRKLKALTEEEMHNPKPVSHRAKIKNKKERIHA